VTEEDVAGRSRPLLDTAHREGFRVSVIRPQSRVAFMEVSSPGYQEFFFVVAGDKTISIVAFDAFDEGYQEGRVWVCPKPHEWSMDVTEEEFLIQVWQTLGVQR
jgi:hypothetical protein